MICEGATRALSCLTTLQRGRSGQYEWRKLQAMSAGVRWSKGRPNERVQVSARLPSMAGKIAFEKSISLETGSIVFSIFGISRVLHALYSRDGVLPDDVTHDATLICTAVCGA